MLNLIGFCSYHFGSDLLRSAGNSGDSVLKLLWHLPDAILCCSLKVNTFGFFFLKFHAFLFVVMLPNLELEDSCKVSD